MLFIVCTLSDPLMEDGDHNIFNIYSLFLLIHVSYNNLVKLTQILERKKHLRMVDNINRYKHSKYTLVFCYGQAVKVLGEIDLLPCVVCYEVTMHISVSKSKWCDA